MLRKQSQKWTTSVNKALVYDHSEREQVSLSIEGQQSAYQAVQVVVTRGTPPMGRQNDRQTDTTENIAFPLLRWRAIMILKRARVLDQFWLTCSRVIPSTSFLPTSRTVGSRFSLSITLIISSSKITFDGSPIQVLNILYPWKRDQQNLLHRAQCTLLLSDYSIGCVPSISILLAILLNGHLTSGSILFWSLKRVSTVHILRFTGFCGISRANLMIL